MPATAIQFPNMTQIPSHVSKRAWWAARIGTLAAALVMTGLLILDESAGLDVFWGLIVPLLPLLFLTAPGLWRNICPLAASNQIPRALGFTRAASAPRWLKQYGFALGMSLFIALTTSRKFVFDDSGAATAALLIFAIAAAFVGGVLLKGKSGWCSTICPLLPVQRVYGQTPFALVGNSHCQPCLGCVKNCYDFNPRVAYLADLAEPDRHWSASRKFFVGAFPGFVYGFFTAGAPPAVPMADVLGHIGLSVAISAAAFFGLESFLRVSVHKVTTVFAATAFATFYWHAAESVVQTLTGGAGPPAVIWAIRAAAIALAATWVVRTFLKETAFERQADETEAVEVIPEPGSRSIAEHRAGSAGNPEVHFVDAGKRVAVTPNATLLDIAEANDLTIEAGCRMGSCGADPVCVVGGMENLTAITDEERNTLERLGLAPNTRLACQARVRGACEIQLSPQRISTGAPARIAGFSCDESVRQVVVLGNGIAGVTAADHVRRRHPSCAIDIVADEAHPLYNRMGIARLIYGRSAMQGLYLNPDAWYAEREITTWLNTRARAIDLTSRSVTLGTGEVLEYDRLILATGSSSFVPPIEGFGSPGSFVLRAAADAIELRAFAQRHAARHAVIAGGGLLGLEAAYAVSKLGLRATVLERSDRLLRRQLDVRAGEILRAYLEGLGLEVVLEAETQAVSANGRVDHVVLKDGRSLPADMILVAAGIQPNVDLAHEAGLAVNRGVVVDDRMRCSDPAVFAVGDVAEYQKSVAGLWPTAVEQAEVAAENAVGGDKRFVGSTPATQLKVVGADLLSVGRFEGAEGDVEIPLESEDGQRYRKFVVDQQGRLVGAIILGYPHDIPGVIAAVRACRDIADDLPALRGGDCSMLAAA